MRRAGFLILLGLGGLTGCAADPDPDVTVYDGPYYYDGRGYYYDDPRAFNDGYDRRHDYGRPYNYIGPYPYFYGRYRYDFADRNLDRRDTDYRRPDNNSTADRQRDRTARPADQPDPDADSRSRILEGRRTKANADASARTGGRKR